MDDAITSKWLGISIRFPAERWFHIIESHPELKNCRDEVEQILKSPDTVYRSEDYVDLFIFEKKMENFITNHLVVYVKHHDDDAHVVTSFPISGKKIEKVRKKWKQVKPFST